jgi:hypothetical protein
MVADAGNEMTGSLGPSAPQAGPVRATSSRRLGRPRLDARLALVCGVAHQRLAASNRARLGTERRPCLGRPERPVG